MGITRTLNRLARLVKESRKMDNYKYQCWGCGRKYLRKSPTYPICGDCGAEIWTREEVEGYTGAEDDNDLAVREWWETEEQWDDDRENV